MKIENHPHKLNGKKRSDLWPSARKKHLKKEPFCRLCGGKTKITVHHIKPFHLHPELELNPKNFITLCEGKKTINCHLIFGHFGNFRTKYNLTVRDDSNRFRPFMMSKKFKAI